MQGPRDTDTDSARFLSRWNAEEIRIEIHFCSSRYQKITCFCSSGPGRLGKFDLRAWAQGFGRNSGYPGTQPTGAGQILAVTVLIKNNGIGWRLVTLLPNLSLYWGINRHREQQTGTVMQRVMRTTLKWSESQQHVLSARATSWCVISARSAHSWMTPHSRSLRIAHNNVTMQMKRDNACRVGGMSVRFHFVPPRNNPSVQLRMAAPAGPDVLKQYGRDLTEDARSGKLDPVIGRDESIRRCLQILSRRTKNNPILIGEPGVGKTAIVSFHPQCQYQ
eukprot:2205223-Rhodomonas_salina.1